MTAGLLPRVSEILRAVGLAPDFSDIPPAALEAARDRGIAVHRYLEALHYAYATDMEIPPAYMGYVSAYEKFLAESGHEPIHSEITLTHPTWLYQGTLDRMGWLNGRRALLDWKTGVVGATARYQLAAYVDLWNARYPDERVELAATVQLMPDGRYSYRQVDLAAALPVWRAAIVVYRAQQNGGAR
jgi:hypothetical protein